MLIKFNKRYFALLFLTASTAVFVMSIFKLHFSYLFLFHIHSFIIFLSEKIYLNSGVSEMFWLKNTDYNQLFWLDFKIFKHIIILIWLRYVYLLIMGCTFLLYFLTYSQAYVLQFHFVVFYQNCIIIHM